MTDDYQKWQRAGDLWWASAGSIRLNALAETNPDALKVKTCLELCEALRKLAVADGWQDGDDEKGAPTDYCFEVIATDGSEIVSYEGDGSFLRLTASGDFAARGTGRKYALGATSALRRYVDYDVSNDEDCGEIIEAALQAACDYDQGCGGTFFVMKIERRHKPPCWRPEDYAVLEGRIVLA